MNSGSTMSELCDLGHVTEHLWALYAMWELQWYLLHESFLGLNVTYLTILLSLTYSKIPKFLLGTLFLSSSEEIVLPP